MLFQLLRVLLFLLMMIIPVPIPALFPKAASVHRKNQVTQVKKMSS